MGEVEGDFTHVSMYKGGWWPGALCGEPRPRRKLVRWSDREGHSICQACTIVSYGIGFRRLWLGREYGFAASAERPGGATAGWAL